MTHPSNKVSAESIVTRWVRLLLALLVLLGNVGPVAAQPAVPEYKLKAVFLFRFADYVTWPASAMPDGHPFVIGIYGNDPFGGFLDDTVHGETVKGHAVEVRRLRSLEEVTTCNMLYVSTSAAGRLPEVLARLKGHPTLTVSDTPEFASRGGMIQLVKKGNRIGFRINVEASKEAGLSISAKLLQMAQIVSTTK